VYIVSNYARDLIYPLEVLKEPNGLENGEADYINILPLK
jgi:hypothetical protein